MLTINLKEPPVKAAWVESRPGQRVYPTLPIMGAKEHTDSSVVYIELRHGEEHGGHADNAECLRSPQR